VVAWPRDLDAYELLRRADIDAYLDLLENFDLHGALYQILEAADRWATTTELCLLLKGARPVFDKDGEWIKRTRLAFIVINFLGSRLLGQPFENGEPSENFKEMLTEIVEALTTRHDAMRWLRSSEQFPRFDKCHSTGFEGCGNFMRRPRRVAG
jgi:hypothetical protein